MKDKILIDGKIYVDYKDARKLILKQVTKMIDETTKIEQKKLNKLDKDYNRQIDLNNLAVAIKQKLKELEK